MVSRILLQTTSALLLSILLFPSAGFPQTTESWKQNDLMVAIQRSPQGRLDEVKALLDAHTSLVTPSLWELLSYSAAYAFYGHGPERALWLYQVTLEVAERLNDRKLLAMTWYNTGRNYSGMGRTEDAIHAYLNSQKFFEEAGLERDLIYVLSGLGSLYFYLDEIGPAKAYSERSLRLAESLKNGNSLPGAWPDGMGVAESLSTLGGILHREGHFERAIDLQRQALSIYQGLSKGSMTYGAQISDAFAEIGRIYTSIGDNLQALVHLNQALDIAKKALQRDAAGRALNGLGILYLEQEDYGKSTDFLNQALELYESLKNRGERARILLNLAVVDHRQSNYDRALERFRESLAEATAVKMRDVIVAAGEGIGAILRVKGDYPAAIEILDRSLRLAEELDAQTRIAEILWRKAEVYISTENYAEAALLAERSLLLARRLRFPNLIHLSAKTLGEALIGLKKTDQAIQVLEQAVEQAESMRYSVAGREQGRQFYFENKVAAYHLLIDLLVRQDRPLDALLYAERAKGRVLLDVLGNGLSKTTLSEKELEEEQRLHQAVVAINNEIRTERLKTIPDAARIATLASQLSAARMKY